MAEPLSRLSAVLEPITNNVKLIPDNVVLRTAQGAKDEHRAYGSSGSPSMCLS